MGDLTEFSLPTRLFLQTYRWRRIDPVPWTPLQKPLAQCRVALVSSAGFTLGSQPPFDANLRGGDWSFREIPREVDVTLLSEYHRSQSFDHSGMHADPNLVLPVDRILELAKAGRIGAVNWRHFSFMGSITAPGRLMRESAPEMARRMQADAVDVALLVPV